MVWTSVDKERAGKGRERGNISEGIDRANVDFVPQNRRQEKGILRENHSERSLDPSTESSYARQS